MARNGRFALVVLVSVVITSTGLCVSLSGGASYCPVAVSADAAPGDHDSCCESERGDAPDGATCPASKERPACRMCDDSVLHLSQLSSSPPRHLLNVTFRN